MLVIGITGGIGSGKSAVCKLLASHYGATVFYADAVAKSLMVKNRTLKQGIKAAFGAESYAPNGTLNRAYLAEKVFNDEAELKKLNALVHPAVRRALRREKKKALQNNVEYLVYEAALLFETNGQQECDVVWAVIASTETRIKRVMQRDNISAEQVQQRINKQLPESEFRKRANAIIINESDENALLEQVEKLLSGLRLAKEAKIG
jgi:dephospho-CoA kinase